MGIQDLTGGENNVIYIDTSIVSRLADLPRGWKPQLRVTKKVKDEIGEFLLKEGSPDIDIDGFIESNIDRLIKEHRYDPEIASAANLIYTVSFYETLLRDMRNRVHDVLEHPRRRNDLSKALFMDIVRRSASLDIGIQAGFMERLRKKYSYNDTWFDKALDWFERKYVSAVSKFFVKKTKTALEKDLKMREEYLNNITVKELTERSRKKTRRWWRRILRANKGSIKEFDIVLSDAERVVDNLSSGNLSLDDYYHPEGLYNYTDLDVFATAFMDACLNKRDVVLYTGDKDYLSAAETISDLTKPMEEGSRLRVIYERDDSIKEVGVNVPYNIHDLTEGLTLRLKHNLEYIEDENVRKRILKIKPYRVTMPEIPPIVEAPLAALATWGFYRVNRTVYDLYSLLIRTCDSASDALQAWSSLPDSDKVSTVAFFTMLPLFALHTLYFNTKAGQVAAKKIKEVYNDGFMEQIEKGRDYLRDMYHYIKNMTRYRLGL